MARPTAKEDILMLRVMRLTNPILEPSLESYLDPHALFDLQVPSEEERVSQWKKNPAHSLVLPMEQEEIYSGETFRAFIHISNLSDVDAFSVTVQVRMNVEQENFTLYDISSSPIDRLSVHQSYEFPIHFPVERSGFYTLICNFSYTIYPSCELISQKRSFQFSAKLPFSVAYSIKKVTAGSYINCLLENTSSRSFILRMANITSSAHFPVQQLKAEETAESSFLNGIHYFKPRDKYALLFSCSIPSNASPNYFQDLEYYGKLSLNWRSASGGNGHYQLALVDEEVKKAKGLSIRVIASPGLVQVESPFEIEIEIFNHSPQELSPILQFDWNEMKPLLMQGAAKQPLQAIEKHSSIRHTLRFVCMIQGFHCLGGVSVYDPIAMEKVTLKAGCELFVL